MAATTHMAYENVEVGGVRFRLSRRAGSGFVGIIRTGRIVGGEIFGYIAGLNTDAPEPRWLARVAEWSDPRARYRTLYRFAAQFHTQCTRDEEARHAA